VIPVLVLVDLLWHDLEEYASDEAVAALGGLATFPMLEALLALPEAERMHRLREATARRWAEKVYFARRRIERLGWEEACHLTTLEILGYRANRVAMLRVAERFPWSVWRLSAPNLDEIVALAADWWTLRGVRPANQPRLRLAQYHAWMQRAPDWPTRLRKLEWPNVPSTLAESDAPTLRRRAALSGWRERIACELCGGALGGTRLDTWICNHLLPFRAAVDPAAGDVPEILWRAWYTGDAPAALLSAIGELTLTRTNGTAQGLLGLQLAGPGVQATT
jgi:hypothetical protein